MWQAQRFRILLLVIILAQVDAGRDNAPTFQCGGELKGPAGTIHTPGFPKPFKVPVKCKWIINNSHVNGSISVYFTQLFTTSGITFTEYLYYDASFKAGERKVLSITDENVTKMKFVKVTSPFLVIDFTLDTLDGTQLRALGLLDMFGFNMTYRVKSAELKTSSFDPIYYNKTAKLSHGTTEYMATEEDTACSVVECSLLGHCYAKPDYSAFYCACFHGFGGKDCSIGRLCDSLRDICKNGGTCKQLGRAAVTCQCPPSYTGESCGVPLRPTECSFMESCGNSKDCECDERTNNMDGMRYDVTLRTTERMSPIKYTEIISELTSYLTRSNITLRGNISIISNTEKQGVDPRSLVVRLLSTAQASGAVRAAMAMLVAHAKLGNVLLQPTHLNFDSSPLLYLQDLTAGASDRVGVWKGADFSLSCITRGSPDTVFEWYKDGHRVNIQKATRDTWQHTVVEESAGRRTALLGARQATRAHAGTWSCVAKDSVSRQCRATQLRVLEPPALIVSPRSITLLKGQSTSVTCLAEAASRTHGTLGFSWSRGKALLPLSPGSEEWEDLYPAGSLLKLYNVTKSSEYQCQMSSTTGTSRQSVHVWVVERDHDACQPGPANGVKFRLAAPGSIAYAECPNGFIGRVKRTCEAATGSSSTQWLVPDFSNCFWQPLFEEYDEFMKLTYGLASRNITEIVSNYGVKMKSIGSLMPGSASLLLKGGVEMLDYVQTLPRGKEQADAAYMLTTIFDAMLDNKDVFLYEERVHEYVRAVLRLATLTRNCTKIIPSNCDSEINKETCSFEGEHFSFFTPQRNTTTVCTQIHFYNKAAQRRWQPYAIHNISPGFVKGTVVYFHSINENLPSLKKRMIYRNHKINLISDQVTHVPEDPLHEVNISVTWLSPEKPEAQLGIVYPMLCGIRTQDKPDVWNFELCTLPDQEPAKVGVETWTCSCYLRSGIVGLFGPFHNHDIISARELHIVYLTIKLYIIVLVYCLCVQVCLRIMYGALSDRAIYDNNIFYCIQQICFLGLLIFIEDIQDTTGGSLTANNSLKIEAWLIRSIWVLGIVVTAIQPCLLIMDVKKIRKDLYLLSVLIVAIWSTVWVATSDTIVGFPRYVHVMVLLCSMLLYFSMGGLWGYFYFLTLNSMLTAASPQDVEPLKRRMHWVCAYVVSLLTVSVGPTGIMAVLPHSALDFTHHFCVFFAFMVLHLVIFGCEFGMWHNIIMFVRRGQRAQLMRGSREQRHDTDDALIDVDAVYWRPAQPGIPISHTSDNNKQEDSRADIVKSVEKRSSLINGPSQIDSHFAKDLRPGPDQLDLIPELEPAPEPVHIPGYVLITSKMFYTKSPKVPIINIPTDEKPVPDVHIVSTKSFNSKSTPDISEHGSPRKVPIKSCLKCANPPIPPKSIDDHSRSLPSVVFPDSINESAKLKDITGIKNQRNLDTGNNVLKKISDDLAFLLNKTPDLGSETSDQEKTSAF